MKDLFTTDGRISRLTFWKFFGCLYALMALMGAAFELLSPPEWVKSVVGLIFLPLILVGIFVQIKRWHDRDKSGWWILINLVPCVGPLWSLIECGFLPGSKGPNQFGPDPLE